MAKKLKKATPAQIKRDHAISRGIIVPKKRNPLQPALGLHPNSPLLHGKREHKGIDKHKGVRYTVATITNKIKERKIKIMENKTKTTKKTQQGAYCRIDGWRGLAGLFVAASIVYANYVVFYGTNGLIPKIMLVPSTLAVVAFLVHKSLK